MLCLELGRLATTTRAGYHPNLAQNLAPLIQRTPRTAPQEILRGFGVVCDEPKIEQRPDLPKIRGRLRLTSSLKRIES